MRSIAPVFLLLTFAACNGDSDTDKSDTGATGDDDDTVGDDGMERDLAVGTRGDGVLNLGRDLTGSRKGGQCGRSGVEPFGRQHGAHDATGAGRRPAKRSLSGVSVPSGPMASM